jgi:hypothetical protein
MVGGLIPIPGLTHYRTVTTAIVNSTTVTVPVTVTRTVVSTTTMSGRVETVTYTTTFTTTTTTIINHTTTVVLPPTTTTVTNTTTRTITTTSIIGYTTTSTTTIIENASQLPPLNMSDPGSILAYIKDDFGLGMMGIANLSLPLGYCIGTMWIFPNTSVVYLAAWFIPQNIAQRLMTPSNYVMTFPKTGVEEYATYVSPSLAVLNYLGNSYYSLEANPTYLVNINYPGNGYIVGVFGSNTVGSLPPWGLSTNSPVFQLLNNGTYIMAIVNSSIPSLMQLVLNPPGLCLIQVIRVKPGTPDSYILNMTFLGAQYWAWVVSEAAWGKPAPCYAPASWTYGYWVYNLNNTKPIGANWDYYCGPGGKWLPLKP